MANDKFYGYTPKKDETTIGWETGPKSSGNRLDKINTIKFWRQLTGNKNLDIDYWRTRIENELY